MQDGAFRIAGGLVLVEGDTEQLSYIHDHRWTRTEIIITAQSTPRFYSTPYENNELASVTSAP